MHYEIVDLYIWEVKPMRDDYVIIRVTAKEKELYTIESERRNMVLSAWIRMILMDEILKSPTRKEAKRKDR